MVNSRRRVMCSAFVVVNLLARASVFGNTIAVTNTADSGAGSLRDAISSALAGDTINVNVTGTISLTSGALLIRKDLTIVGPGPDHLAISGTNSSRVFTIADIGTATVAISGVAIQNGRADNGGGILNGGRLTVTNSVVAGNSASSNGGGVYNGGTLSLADSRVTTNVASVYGGGVYNETDATLTLTNSIVSGNTASIGGGISNHDGTVTLRASTVSANSAAGSYGGSGGGIYNGGLGGTVNLRDSTVSNNRASDEAGAIYQATGTLAINNSTIANNSSSCNSGGCAGGGGIFNLQANAFVGNSTLSANASLAGGNVISLYGTTTLENSILAKGPSATNCSPYGSSAIVSHGHNLSDDTSCSSVFTQPGDLNDTPSGLTPYGLQNNGGPTQTIALLATSPAVDAVPLDACAAATGSLIADERGVSRPQGAACDIGAFELTPSPFVAHVGQPVNTDGTSVFSTKRGVVPVKFTLTYSGIPTCQLPPATISVFRTAGTAAGLLNESAYLLAADSGSNFRVDAGACQYVYNLGSSSLGPGTYAAYISIDGVIVGTGTFGLQ